MITTISDMDNNRKKEIFEASRFSYMEALNRCYSGNELAFFMFLEGMNFQKTGVARVDPLEEAIKNIKTKE